MNRRDFMKGILAAAVAPAFVRAESLMPINSRILVPDRRLILPESATGFLTIHRGDGAELARVAMGIMKECEDMLRMVTQYKAEGPATVLRTGVAAYAEIDNPLVPGDRYKIDVVEHSSQSDGGGIGLLVDSKHLLSGQTMWFS